MKSLRSLAPSLRGILAISKGDSYKQPSGFIASEFFPRRLVYHNVS